MLTRSQTPTRFTLALVVLANRLYMCAAASSNEWQYFCFAPGTKLAQLGKRVRFTLLPEADTPSPPLPPPLPTPEEDTPESPLSGAGDDDTTAPDTLDSVSTRLRPIMGTCYFMRVGYWNYEVCPFTSVRQYHSETGAAGGAPVHNEFSLGSYTPGQDSWNSEARILTQQFAQGGTEGRSSRVKYLCPDSWREEDGIVMVHEPSPKQVSAAECAPGSPRGSQRRMGASPQ